MFHSDINTNEWEMAEEQPHNPEVIQVDMSHYSELIEASNMLYALRKAGCVSEGDELLATELLKEEERYFII